MQRNKNFTEISISNKNI